QPLHQRLPLRPREKERILREAPFALQFEAAGDVFDTILRIPRDRPHPIAFAKQNDLAHLELDLSPPRLNAALVTEASSAGGDNCRPIQPPTGELRVYVVAHRGRQTPLG